MKKLVTFHNRHFGQTIVVCGCGESLNDLPQPERFITIGVNDVGRLFQPRYLVIVNPRNQFTDDRFRFVEASQAEYLFTQLDLGVSHPNIVRFQLGEFGGTDLSRKDVLHYTNNSPYIALNLAILMGARRIGLIGVDFTDNHFFAETGTHPLAPQFDSINEQYCRLAEAAKAQGIEIFNLSKRSRLTAFPKKSLSEFASENPPAAAGGSDPLAAEKSGSLKIVSYSTMPVAGVPAILARCINGQTEDSARCVWATNGYGNGVEFAGDVEWRNQPQLAEDLLADADLVIVHNGKIATEHERFFEGKSVVTMAHNYKWNVDCRFVEQGFPGAVVGQFQAALAEFNGWSIVPNPLPFWETDYQNRAKTEQISICYTPFGRHEKYSGDDKLYWHSKGFETTLQILEKLKRRFDLNLEIVSDRQVSHRESLAMKCRSHIVIDECVTGSYHRNSLEGLAAGAVVVNGVGLLPEISKVFQRCAGKSAKNPFVFADLDSLEQTLEKLISRGAENLKTDGEKNREWIEKHWIFARQWEKFWTPLVEQSLARRTNRIPPKRFAKENISILEPKTTNERRKVESMTIARNEDLNLREFAAFNEGHNYPQMRRWELPFALFQMQLSGFMSVLDCTINPVNFADRIAVLYPNVAYRHFQVVQQNRFVLPFGMPDGEFDRIVCINTLEHLLKPQREQLLAEMTRKLKPGGLLVITCDQYPDSFWENNLLLERGFVRADREEVFNGFNQVTERELIDSLKKHGLIPLKEKPDLIEENEKYRNTEPYPHACLGAVFVKGEQAVFPESKKIMFSLLSWNTREATLESLEAYLKEAAMLERLGIRAFVVVCDNGSTDGTAEALRDLDEKINIPHRFILNKENLGSSLARNQIIDLLLNRGDDYLMMMDGDIEIVPFSSFAMLRYMEEQGRLLGCLGPHSSGYSPERSRTTRFLFDLNNCPKTFFDFLAWTQYGIFRREVFADGVRFDDNKPFNGAGWGFEDNDLAFQMVEKGYRIQVFTGMTYLHRDVHSSIRVMKSNGTSPLENYEDRRDYIINKWSDSDLIPPSVIHSLQTCQCPQV